MEDFVTATLEAYTNSNGDIDKFELALRRLLMNQQKTVTPAPEFADGNFELSDELAQELISIDLDGMSDEEVLQYATKMGLIR